MENQIEKLSELIISDYNNKVIELWKKYGNIKETKISPILHYELYKNTVLFIGVNPSFSIKNTLSDFNKIKGFEKYCENIEKFHAFRNYEKFKNDYKIFSNNKRLNNHCKDTCSAFHKKFNELAEQINSKWEHIDLFNLRLTNQKDFKKIIEIHPEFFAEQLKNNINLIYSIEPYIIIVVNALASSIIKEKLILTFNENLGTYTFKVSDNIIPVFFSGMLSGPGALDLHTLERLKWHIRFVERNLNL